ncbi:putative lipoprotein [Burkholderia sp. 8Y]|uniref:DUF1254 domain-containing protein n=1 Tax=Burkholderia sp. 8Y TaxID=2653133 RepID=UPI0012F0BA5F|nr:DUF1254 domain-containing protein [Burkholderia sp. 8Y]VXB33681.1 putative lipoprotein [Burkholderia sp. 8Y]
MNRVPTSFSLKLPFAAAALCAALQFSVDAHALEAARTAPATVMPAPGPDSQGRITESYARLVARDALFWAWPMVNVYNRRLAFKRAPEPGLAGGVLPFAPLNRMAMLTDYMQPNQRWVACPNQDVVYGAGILALDASPVVIQVPDFGKRFWVYQLANLRTDGFATLGSMYGTKPGFYMVVGPRWKGEVPAGIIAVLHADSQTAMVIPRVFQADTPEDRAAVEAVIRDIDVYPLADYDGRMKRRDWHTLRVFPEPAGSGDGEVRWVRPETFFDELPAVLADAPPRAGEEAMYAKVLAVIAAARKDPALKAAMIDEAKKAEQELVDPLLQFRKWGAPLPFHWTTLDDGARFGVDYFTRTAVAKSNIMVNAANETRYYYQDLDASGNRLDGKGRYEITFAKGQLPPTRGFWSLALYDDHHFFVKNALNRYALGTRNTQLQYGSDGSLTLYLQADSPGADKEANWLPAPAGASFSLMLRNYGPAGDSQSANWTPPAVVRLQ